LSIEEKESQRQDETAAIVETEKSAPGSGLEPETLPLTAACSTIELTRNVI
jgi:hypothetical protein